MTAPKDSHAAITLVEMAMAYFRGKALCAAVRLGIPDALGNAERSLDELAAETQSNPDALNRLLRALAAVGVAEEVAPGHFVLTPFGDPLRKDSPNSVWASIVFWADLIEDAWTYLPECVRAGDKSGADAVMERDGVRSRWSLEPDAPAIFHAVFAEPSVEAMAPIVAAYDFAECETVADLGGAGGSLVSAILTENAELRGILVDREEALERAAQHLTATGLADRCRLVAADLLQTVPRGVGIYILKSVLHGYENNDAGRILVNVLDAMEPASRLLVIEAVLPETICAGDPEVEKMLMSDLNMLLVTGGHERKRTEWESLLSSAGFECSRVLPVPGATYRIIEAVPRVGVGDS